MHLDDLKAHLLALEAALLDVTDPDLQQKFERYLADNFLAYTPDGVVMNKQQVIRFFLEHRHLGTPMRDIRDVSLRVLADDAVQLNYRATQGYAEDAKTTLRTSVWQLQPEGWCIASHDATTVPGAGAD